MRSAMWRVWKINKSTEFWGLCLWYRLDLARSRILETCRFSRYVVTTPQFFSWKPQMRVDGNNRPLLFSTFHLSDKQKKLCKESACWINCLRRMGRVRGKFTSAKSKQTKFNTKPDVSVIFLLCLSSPPLTDKPWCHGDMINAWPNARPPVIVWTGLAGTDPLTGPCWTSQMAKTGWNNSSYCNPTSDLRNYACLSGVQMWMMHGEKREEKNRARDREIERCIFRLP